MKRAGVLALMMGVASPRDARACICDMPPLVYVSPVSDAAPTNTHVRILARRAFPVAGFIVRPHGGGPNVELRARAIPGRSLETEVELVPTAPLRPSTRYEVARVDPTVHPSTTVIGTFKTSTSPDTAAPRLDSLGHAGTHLPRQVGTCPLGEAFITLEGMVARDDRPDAKLAYAVWEADLTGKLDTERPPDDLVNPSDGKLSIGHVSGCNFEWFSLGGDVVDLAVAAVDEAGNTSRPLRLHADLTRERP